MLVAWHWDHQDKTLWGAHKFPWCTFCYIGVWCRPIQSQQKGCFSSMNLEPVTHAPRHFKEWKHDFSIIFQDLLVFSGKFPFKLKGHCPDCEHGLHTQTNSKVIIQIPLYFIIKLRLLIYGIVLLPNTYWLLESWPSKARLAQVKGCS